MNPLIIAVIFDLVEIWNTIREVIYQGWHNFVDLNTRIHFLYFLSAVILTFYVYKKLKLNGGFLKYLLPKENYLGTSAIIDYSFFVANLFFKVLFLGGLNYWSINEANNFNEWLLANFGMPEYRISLTTVILLYTIVYLVISDLSYYVLHLLYHKIPFLWRFHKVHHSATALNPLTQYRVHPVELALNNFRFFGVLIFMNGLFDYFTPAQYGPITIFGINATLFLFNIWGANLRHSHVKLTYFSWLENWLISPYQHQIHHSAQKELYDKNIGSKLAIWDRLFGTLVKSDEVKELKLGLGEENTHYNSFFKNLLNPFFFRNKKGI